MILHRRRKTSKGPERSQGGMGRKAELRNVSRPVPDHGQTPNYAPETEAPSVLYIGNEETFMAGKT